jgi:hypothetical protein
MATILNKIGKSVNFDASRHDLNPRGQAFVATAKGKVALRLIGKPDVAEWVSNGLKAFNDKGQS